MTRAAKAVLVGAIGAVLLLSACARLPFTQALATAAAPTGAGQWFVDTGCTACHSVSSHGLMNLAASAPDLSLAVEDVPKRFGRPLEEFLHAPTGTMAMVLSSRITLSPAERDVAIAHLREAYRLHLGVSEPLAPVASH